MSDTARELDNYLWGLFVKACGHRCCACLKEPKAGETLHRGHLQPRADGGSSFLDNLVPLCKGCNSKFKAGYTDDTRPAEWPDAFLRLLMDQMNVGIYARPHENTPAHINRSERDDNKVFLTSDAFKIGPKKHYHTPTSTNKQITASQVEAVIEKAKSLRRNEEGIPEPRPPLRKVQDEWRGLVARHGQQDFLIALYWGYLRDPEPAWLKNGEPLTDSWVFFACNLGQYLKRGLKRKDVYDDQQRKKADAWAQERERIAGIYREVRAIPRDWPLLTPAQRDIIEGTPENPETIIGDEVERAMLMVARQQREKLLEDYKRLGPDGDLGAIKRHLRYYLEQLPARWIQTQEWQNLFYAVRNAESMDAIKPLIVAAMTLTCRRNETPTEEHDDRPNIPH